MKLNSRVLVLGSLALGFAFGNLAMSACDNKGSSESVGPCKDEIYECSSFPKEKTCLAMGPKLEVFVVNQDFPTNCVFSMSRNCKLTLHDCYRSTDCEWQAGKCIPIDQASNTRPWTKKAKRGSEFCGSAGLEPGPGGQQ